MEVEEKEGRGGRRRREEECSSAHTHTHSHLPHVDRLLPSELLQDEELVPHPAPPPPALVGVATRGGPSPVHRLQLDRVEGHGAGAPEHGEHAQDAQQIHAAGVCVCVCVLA